MYSSHIKSLQRWKYAVLFSTSFFALSLAQQGLAAEMSEIVLADFDQAEVPQMASVSNGELSLTGGTEKALFVTLNATAHQYSGLSITPSKPWDFTQTGTFGLVMDIGNPGPHPIHLNLDVSDAKGQNFTRSVVIPVGPATSYYAELQGADVDADTGLRDNPPAWDIGATNFIWMWGEENLDVSAITSVKLSVKSLQFDRSFTLDNLRIVSNPKTDKNYLTGIVDEFGQSAKVDFTGKVKSIEDIIRNHESERAQLTSDQPFIGRSQYGGWKAGPKLRSTGYFRTQKYRGKWAIIDPEGYLFFSTGIANIRLDNTVTLTGVDFDQDAIRNGRRDEISDPSAIYPSVPNSALKTAFNASKLRRDMFRWLPADNDPLANHYGYRSGSHTGPLKTGQSFGFYSANLERKYGETSPKSYIADWRATTEDRMLNWGFTSFGNWADPEYYKSPRLPYFANGWISGGFKTVSSGDDFWAPLPDPFDPEFKSQADITAKKVAGEVAGSPWCIGVFIDNEKSWGRMGTVRGQYGIVINTLSRSDFESPTKAEFTRLLKVKYADISFLNKAWGTEFESWKTIRRGVILKTHNSAQQADFAILLKAYARQYFKVVDQALNAHLPDHMYLGVRFATWGMTPEVIEASSEFSDIISYNEYSEIPHPNQWAFLDNIDKPAIIGEFHMGSRGDTGFFHPGLVHAVDQKDRARMFENYMNIVIDNPNFVGAHWFQYIDSPITGRAYDGENYNVGFVSVTDTPYAPLVDAAKRVNSNLYQRRFGTSPK